jgi:hypothetical protein
MTASRERWYRAGIVLFFIGLLGLLFINIKSPFNFYDEGFAVLGGERVLHGEVPYRDFWALYPPGQFYLLAGSFKLFGSDLMTSRTYDTLVRFAIVVCVYAVTRRLVGRGLALFLALVIAFMLAAVGFYSYAIFPALALNLAAFVSFIRYTRAPSGRRLFLTGLLVGAAALVRLDLGLYATVSLSAAAFLFAFLTEWRSQDTLAQGQSRWLRGFTAALRGSLALPAGVLLVMLPVYGLVIWQSGWANVLEQLYIFPSTTFHAVRWMPYPSLNPFNNDSLRPWYEFYLPLLLFAMAFAYYASRIFLDKQADLGQSAAALALTAFGSLLFAQALSRYDYIHVLPSTILALTVAVMLFAHLRADNPSTLSRIALPVMLFVVVWLYLLPTFAPLRNAMRHYPPTGCYSELEKAACVVVAPDQQQAAQYIQANSAPGDRIYSGNTRHDSVFVNDVGFYYLADRLPGTRYHELHPGSATTLAVQEEIAQNLTDHQVEWAVLADIWQSNEPNDSRLSSSVYFLDQYLSAGYQPANQYGMYQIWRKK